MNDLKERMEVAADLAWKAGRLTLRYFRSGVSVDRKADRTPVTIADREAEDFLVRELSKAFPGDGFLGEESGETPGETGYRWILDPIDGTESFIRGVPLYGVLIGLENADGRSVVGAIALPALDELVVAARGLGCFANGRRARVSQVDRVEQACVAYGEDEGFLTTKRTAAQRRLVETAGSARSWCDCYGHVLVATGRVEAMFDPILSIWDCAALQPIVEEAGGVFTDWHGQETIHGESGISSNAALAQELRALVADGGK